MFPYIVRRIIIMILMLTILSIVTFLLFNAVPTDPARLTCGKNCTPDVIAVNRIRLGLDQPLYIQYFEWIKGIFVGRTYGSGSATFECSAPCLGYSFRNGEEVTTMIVDALPVTMYLALGAFLLWMIVGIQFSLLVYFFWFSLSYGGTCCLIQITNRHLKIPRHFSKPCCYLG